LREVVCSSPHMHYDCYYSKINQEEVRIALQKMGRNKAVGPDQIPVEAWRCLEDERGEMADLPFQQEFLKGIKLLSHTMKLLERVIERRLKRETRVSENQFSFMPGRSTTEAIHLLRSPMEKYKERQRDLHMAFLDLEQAYNSVPRELVWRTLIDKGTPKRYLRVIRDMYEGAKTYVRTTLWNTKFFPVEVESAEGLSNRLESWRKALEDNGLRVSREKTEYLICEFGRYEVIHQEVDIRIGDRILQPKESFRYLGSVIHRPGKIDEDVAHRIIAAIRPAMLYGLECWPITKAQANRMEVVELRMLRWTCGRTMVDMIPNGVFKAVLKVDSIIDKMREGDSPDEMASPEYITLLPATLPFLFTDSCEDSDPSKAFGSSEAPPSQDPYVTTVAPILIRPGEAIPLGRPYCTRPNGPQRDMTVRKRVGPLPTRRLAWRRVSPCFLNHRPSSSSSPTDSSPLYSLGLDVPGQAHSGSSNRVVSPRLGYLLSSSGDSSERPLHSSSHSAGPSRKRCRSPIDFVPSSAPVIGLLAPTRADLLPPHKRFRDSYSPETSMEEDIEIDTIETRDDRELDIVDRDDVRDHIEVDPMDDREEFEASAGDTVVLGIDLRSVPMVDEEIIEPVGGGSSSSSGTRDGTVRSIEDMSVDLDGAIHDFYPYMSEVCVDRIVGIETTQRKLEANQMIVSGERAGMAESIRSLRSENLKVRALLCIERDRVDSLPLHMSRSQEEFR
nr:integrator complex subunit 11 [Tanacetum cinerariifolium]